MKILLLLLSLFYFSDLLSQTCPKYGSATDPEGKRLNRLKNRSVNVSDSDSAEYLPLKNLITSKKRKDRDLWSENAYVYTEGYLVSAEEQGPESCNCKKASKKLKNGDVHIYLALMTDAPKKNSVVIEITPAFKKENPEYATCLGVDNKIRVYGYLFYDVEHENASFTTCKKCDHIWRKTCWEVHPITRMEVLQ
jgi:hypothetical protein